MPDSSRVVVKLISNRGGSTHADEIASDFARADDIWMAVAFLKDTGLMTFKPQLQKALERQAVVTFVAGLDFYLTDPTALKELFKLSENASLDLFLYTGGRHTFHPKLYVFKGGQEATAYVGSANLTAGGLTKNVEVSVRLNSRSDAEIWDEIDLFQQEIITAKECRRADWLVIQQYETAHKVFHRQVRKAERVALKEVSKLASLSGAKLNTHLGEYRRDPGEQRNFRLRERNYKTAREVLAQIRQHPNLSGSAFMPLYEQLVGAQGKGHLWHSGSLYRSKKRVADDYDGFQEMLKQLHTIKDNPRVEVFGEARKWEQAIDGLGMNVVTEILHTWDPAKYPVLNNNPISSLEHLGLGAFKGPQSFKPNDYEDFAEVLARLRDECKLKDYARTDHFLNFIYWREHPTSRPAKTRASQVTKATVS